MNLRSEGSTEEAVAYKGSSRHSALLQIKNAIATKKFQDRNQP